MLTQLEWGITNVLVEKESIDKSNLLYYFLWIQVIKHIINTYYYTDWLLFKDVTF